MEARKKRTSFSATGHHGKRARNDKLINAGRHVEPLGPAWVDDTGAITQSLANAVFHRAMCLETFYSTLNGSEESYYGQMGLIRGERLTSSPDNVDRSEAKRQKRSAALTLSSCFRATPHTALHNVINEEEETYDRATLHCASPPMKSSTIKFPEGGRELTENDLIEIFPATEEDEAFMWESRDVTIGNVIADPNHFLTKKPFSYEKVPDGFELRAGQKIGIAVYRMFDITAEDAGAAEGEDLTKIYGKKNLVCIYTGEITEPSSKGLAFQHSINTFCGCSGAIVFLLDKNQSDEEVKRHVGKAIGVHVGGAPEGHLTNVAFKI